MATIATVSPTELIRSTWGNSVAVELNTRCVKVDGSTPVTGTLIVNGSPGLALRNSGNTPYLEFQSTTGTRYGYIQATPTLLKQTVDSASGTLTFDVATTTKLYVNNTDVVVTGAATFNAEGASYFHAWQWIGGNGHQINLVDTATSGSNFYNTNINFYGGGTSMASPGTRTGFIGYAGTSTLTLTNEVSGGGIGFTPSASAAVTFNNPGSSPVVFKFDATEYGRIGGPGNGAQFMWGKSATGVAGRGVEISPLGRVDITNTTGVPLYLRKNATPGEFYVQFAIPDGSVVADIRNATIGVQFPNCVATAPSDYRLKDELGPIVNPVDRVMTLQPKRLAWKDSGAQFDGFIAHELDQVVPDAVYGNKDQTHPDGSIDPQQVTMEPVVPLLTAAIQELAQRVEALEAV